MFNNLHIASVHVHERALFFVVCGPSGETRLQKSDGVRESLLRLLLALPFNALSLRLFKLSVVTFVKLFLQVKDLVLEGKLIDLVLSLEGKDLIVSILAEARTVISLGIKLFDVVNSFVDFTAVSLVDTRLVLQLFAPGVDVFPQNLVLGLQSVQLDRTVLATVLKQFYFVLVLAHTSC